ncbi:MULTISPECIES: DUF3422 family protein [Mameliella]|uniref:Egg lysin n=1 Tax=Mameliella alba TaxID=561184 RepID=A0A0B3RVH1_9RHOB|nr:MULTISPECIES: DUF3422 domain-containing protein [Mameliella]ODM49640.1 hypothetical protein A9320_14155 [Ruegeria sp. PBVC088]KHQ52132.1 hypothetical protein OA50_03147 [Mameliella alba]MBY6119983.1 DUF3422 domain-containing protein [Mameliella alba]MDD9729679.1 DUF3422 domain-containing protein [Mameliella sp. AT18]OWV45924.1 hypothetical protein CDZ95_02950 [Mameliella alba]
MPPIQDHPLRFKLANELHARPFPSLTAPCRAIYLAIKQPKDAAARDRGADLAHLIDLLDRHETPHPQPGATHYQGRIGQFMLKWEQHTEFVTYTVFMPGLGDRAFDPADFDVFPPDWLARAPGVRVTSAMLRIDERPADDTAISRQLHDWLVPESVAVSEVIDGDAVIAGDFRIDPAGHQRFAIFVREGIGQRRVGRIVQRLCEIETYKAMSMLGFTRVREISPRLGEIDTELTRLMQIMTDEDGQEEGTLKALLKVSAQLESLSARMSFRLGATGAYEAIVGQRIEVLREERFQGRQTFSEFMMRRYDPAMRTVKSAERRLESMTNRATRAADLLRTRVEVGRSAQNQQLLESMDKRAELQLQLQKTVEGLSVVAISYYAVSLAGYLMYPVADLLGISKGMMTAILTLPVVAVVWLMIRRIRHHMEDGGPDL